jgi:hypothetical protein
MKNILLFTFVWFISISLFAQNNATISGRVFDDGTNQPLPFTSITLNLGEKTVAGTISGDDGRFVISGVAHGNYIVKCSFVGYQISEIPVLVGVLNNNHP